MGSNYSFIFKNSQKCNDDSNERTQKENKSNSIKIEAA